MHWCIHFPAGAHFVSAIPDANVPLEPQRAQAEGRSAVTLQRRHPEIGLWLFECANMPPYANAVSSRRLACRYLTR